MQSTHAMATAKLPGQDLSSGQSAGSHTLWFSARMLLRAEGLFYLLLACVLYQRLGFSWGSFALWFLLPDLALLAYIGGNARLGMWAYNATHSSMGAVLAGLCGVLMAQPLLWQISLIWFAHIGFDRVLGYGLKSPLGFRITHLGVIGGMRGGHAG